MNDFRISLVIPAYNEEGYIRACLEHVFKNASGRFHEIIVVVNASTDRTKEIAESFIGVRVVLEDNKGVMKARQKGVDLASGDLIAFMDADTRVTAEWVDQIVTEFSGNENLVCLSGPYHFYDFKRWLQIGTKLYWYN